MVLRAVIVRAASRRVRRGEHELQQTVDLLVQQRLVQPPLADSGDDMPVRYTAAGRHFQRQPRLHRGDAVIVRAPVAHDETLVAPFII